jgi:Cu(I)/Ag(I) efflux system membrane fusion protein
MSKAKTPVFLLVLAVASFLAGSLYHQRVHPPTSAKAERKILYYVDPMHPAYKADKPGIAPDCGMQLEPVYADGGSPGEARDGGAPPSLAPGTVQVSPDKQQLIGVRIGQVERMSGSRVLRALGRIALDETRVSGLSAAVDGWIRNAQPLVAGSIVGKDEVLATFYSRDVLTAQQTYLNTLNTVDQFKNDKEPSDQLKFNQAKLQAAKDNLEFLGVGETQVREIARTRQIAGDIELRSPVAGMVTARNVFPGLRFERGKELFRIAELAHVWILADVFGDEAQYFRPGTAARVTLPHQQRTFQAQVSEALPQFDPATRTLKIRLEADNPDYELRPDMFVSVELSVRMPPGLSVPADAVLDSGTQKRVFVDRGNGFFEPRTVETGWRFGDRVEIVKGLTPGERVLISGTFLVDSESQLKLAAAGISSSAGSVPQQHTADASGLRQEAREMKRPQGMAGSPKDPTCGMEVDPAKAKASGNVLVYRGTTYYFCSSGCKDKFQRDPQRYLASAMRGSR